MADSYEIGSPVPVKTGATFPKRPDWDKIGDKLGYIGLTDIFLITFQRKFAKDLDLGSLELKPVGKS